MEKAERIDESSGDIIDAKKLGTLTAEVMNNPEVLAAMQTRLAGFVTTEHFRLLPRVVKRRVKALKKLQLETLRIDAECCRDAYQLEVKYSQMKNELYRKRHDIIAGTHEPDDNECDFPEDEDEEEEKADDARAEKGIPEFWLMILKNVDLIAENIQTHDEPILQHLIDIRALYSEQMKCVLEFHFSPNEFFANDVLTKEYEFKCEPDSDDPWSFDGLAIVKCKGCTIDWKKGKNVTEKMIVKKQKHKSKGQVRTVTKTVKNDSFFNFFDPPKVPDNPEEVDEDTDAIIQADFEIGEVIRTSIIPRAVLFFTGEALDDEEYDDEEDEDDEEEDEDEEEDDDDESERPKVGSKAKGHGGKHNAKKTEEKPPECKQQ